MNRPRVDFIDPVGAPPDRLWQVSRRSRLCGNTRSETGGPTVAMSNKGVFGSNPLRSTKHPGPPVGHGEMLWSRPQSLRVRSPVETVDDEVQAELERVAKVVSGFEYVLECQLGEVAVVVGGKMSRNLLGDLGENPPRRLPATWLPRRQTRRRNCRGWRKRVPSSGSTTHRSADTR